MSTQLSEIDFSSDEEDTESSDDSEVESLERETVLEVLHTNDGASINIIGFMQHRNEFISESDNGDDDIFPSTKNTKLENDRITRYLSVETPSDSNGGPAHTFRNNNDNLSHISNSQPSSDRISGLGVEVQNDNTSQPEKVDKGCMTEECLGSVHYIKFKRTVENFLVEEKYFVEKLKQLCQEYAQGNHNNENAFRHVMEVVKKIYAKSSSLYQQILKVEINEYNVIRILQNYSDIYEMYFLFNRTRNKAKRQGVVENNEKFTLDQIDDKMDKYLVIFKNWREFISDDVNKQAISRIIGTIYTMQDLIEQHFFLDKIKEQPFSSKELGKLHGKFSMDLTGVRQKANCIIVFDKLVMFIQEVPNLKFVDFLPLNLIKDVEEIFTLRLQYTFKIKFILEEDTNKFGYNNVIVSTKKKDIFSKCYETLRYVLQNKPYITY